MLRNTKRQTERNDSVNGPDPQSLAGFPQKNVIFKAFSDLKRTNSKITVK